MSKRAWKFTITEIKRAVEAVQRSGLPVSGVRLSDDAIHIETRATEPTAPVADSNEGMQSDQAPAPLC
jgi:hypothetical protein